MNYIVLDLEATCKENDRSFPNEIIEIGAVKVDRDFNVVSTFEAFVKPKLNPVLTQFCKELTSITQAEVDNAKSYPEVLAEFKEWAGIGKEDYLLLSWGYYDRSQFAKDCRRHGLPETWTEKHISLKHQFGFIRNERPCGMVKALRKLNISLEGTHHRGIDDAINIAKIFVAYKDKWELK